MQWLDEGIDEGAREGKMVYFLRVPKCFYSLILNRHRKHVNNTYEARLERLKEELTSPTMAEIMQMHKENRQLHNAKPYDEKDYVIDEVPSHHLPNRDAVSKKTTTMRTATEEITTHMPIIAQTSDGERYFISI